MTRLEILRDKLTRCPVCKGRGGESDFDGFTSCWFCNGYQYVNVIKKHIYYPVLLAVWKIQGKIQRRCL